MNPSGFVPAPERGRRVSGNVNEASRIASELPLGGRTGELSRRPAIFRLTTPLQDGITPQQGETRERSPRRSTSNRRGLGLIDPIPAPPPKNDAWIHSTPLTALPSGSMRRESLVDAASERSAPSDDSIRTRRRSSRRKSKQLTLPPFSLSSLLITPGSVTTSGPSEVPTPRFSPSPSSSDLLPSSPSYQPLSATGAPSLSAITESDTLPLESLPAYYSRQLALERATTSDLEQKQSQALEDRGSSHEYLSHPINFSRSVDTIASTILHSRRPQSPSPSRLPTSPLPYPDQSTMTSGSPSADDLTSPSLLDSPTLPSAIPELTKSQLPQSILGPSAFSFLPSHLANQQLIEHEKGRLIRQRSKEKTPSRRGTMRRGSNSSTNNEGMEVEQLRGYGAETAGKSDSTHISPRRQSVLRQSRSLQADESLGEKAGKLDEAHDSDVNQRKDGTPRENETRSRVMRDVELETDTDTQSSVSWLGSEDSRETGTSLSTDDDSRRYHGAGRRTSVASTISSSVALEELLEKEKIAMSLNAQVGFMYLDGQTPVPTLSTSSGSPSPPVPLLPLTRPASLSPASHHPSPPIPSMPTIGIIDSRPAGSSPRSSVTLGKSLEELRVDVKEMMAAVRRDDRARGLSVGLGLPSTPSFQAQRQALSKKQIGSPTLISQSDATQLQAPLLKHDTSESGGARPSDEADPLYSRAQTNVASSSHLRPRHQRQDSTDVSTVQSSQEGGKRTATSKDTVINRPIQPEKGSFRHPLGSKATVFTFDGADDDDDADDRSGEQHSGSHRANAVSENDTHKREDIRVALLEGNREWAGRNDQDKAFTFSASGSTISGITLGLPMQSAHTDSIGGGEDDDSVTFADDEQDLSQSDQVPSSTANLTKRMGQPTTPTLPSNPNPIARFPLSSLQGISRSSAASRTTPSASTPSSSSIPSVPPPKLPTNRPSVTSSSSVAHEPLADQRDKLKPALSTSSHRYHIGPSSPSLPSTATPSIPSTSSTSIMATASSPSKQTPFTKALRIDVSSRPVSHSIPSPARASPSHASPLHSRPSPKSSLRKQGHSPRISPWPHTPSAPSFSSSPTSSSRRHSFSSSVRPHLSYARPIVPSRPFSLPPHIRSLLKSPPLRDAHDIVRIAQALRHSPLFSFAYPTPTHPQSSPSSTALSQGSPSRLFATPSAEYHSPHSISSSSSLHSPLLPITRDLFRSLSSQAASLRDALLNPGTIPMSQASELTLDIADHLLRTEDPSQIRVHPSVHLQFELARHVTAQVHTHGEVIFEPGDLADSAYVVLAGEVAMAVPVNGPTSSPLSNTNVRPLGSNSSSSADAFLKSSTPRLLTPRGTRNASATTLTPKPRISEAFTFSFTPQDPISNISVPSTTTNAVPIEMVASRRDNRVIFPIPPHSVRIEQTNVSQDQQPLPEPLPPLSLTGMLPTSRSKAPQVLGALHEASLSEMNDRPPADQAAPASLMRTLEKPGLSFLTMISTGEDIDIDSVHVAKKRSFAAIASCNTYIDKREEYKSQEARVLQRIRRKMKDNLDEDSINLSLTEDGNTTNTDVSSISPELPHSDVNAMTSIDSNHQEVEIPPSRPFIPSHLREAPVVVLARIHRLTYQHCLKTALNTKPKLFLGIVYAPGHSRAGVVSEAQSNEINPDDDIFEIDRSPFDKVKDDKSTSSFHFTTLTESITSSTTTSILSQRVKLSSVPLSSAAVQLRSRLTRPLPLHPHLPLLSSSTVLQHLPLSLLVALTSFTRVIDMAPGTVLYTGYNPSELVSPSSLLQSRIRLDQSLRSPRDRTPIQQASSHDYQSRDNWNRKAAFKPTLPPEEVMKGRHAAASGYVYIVLKGTVAMLRDGPSSTTSGHSRSSPTAGKLPYLYVPYDLQSIHSNKRDQILSAQDTSALSPLIVSRGGASHNPLRNPSTRSASSLVSVEESGPPQPTSSMSAHQGDTYSSTASISTSNATNPQRMTVLSPLWGFIYPRPSIVHDTPFAAATTQGQRPSHDDNDTPRSLLLLHRPRHSTIDSPSASDSKTQENGAMEWSSVSSDHLNDPRHVDVSALSGTLASTLTLFDMVGMERVLVDPISEDSDDETKEDANEEQAHVSTPTENKASLQLNRANSGTREPKVVSHLQLQTRGSTSSISSSLTGITSLADSNISTPRAGPVTVGGDTWIPNNTLPPISPSGSSSSSISRSSIGTAFSDKSLVTLPLSTLEGAERVDASNKDRPHSSMSPFSPKSSVDSEVTSDHYIRHDRPFGSRAEVAAHDSLTSQLSNGGGDGRRSTVGSTERTSTTSADPSDLLSGILPSPTIAAGRISPLPERSFSPTLHHSVRRLTPLRHRLSMLNRLLTIPTLSEEVALLTGTHLWKLFSSSAALNETPSRGVFSSFPLSEHASLSPTFTERGAAASKALFTLLLRHKFEQHLLTASVPPIEVASWFHKSSSPTSYSPSLALVDAGMLRDALQLLSLRMVRARIEMRKAVTARIKRAKAKLREQREAKWKAVAEKRRQVEIQKREALAQRNRVLLDKMMKGEKVDMSASLEEHLQNEDDARVQEELALQFEQTQEEIAAMLVRIREDGSYIYDDEEAAKKQDELDEALIDDPDKTVDIDLDLAHSRDVQAVADRLCSEFESSDTIHVDGSAAMDLADEDTSTPLAMLNSAVSLSRTSKATVADMQTYMLTREMAKHDVEMAKSVVDELNALRVLDISINQDVGMNANSGSQNATRQISKGPGHPALLAPHYARRDLTHGDVICNSERINGPNTMNSTSKSYKAKPALSIDTTASVSPRALPSPLRTHSALAPSSLLTHALSEHDVNNATALFGRHIAGGSSNLFETLEQAFSSTASSPSSKFAEGNIDQHAMCGLGASQGAKGGGGGIEVAKVGESQAQPEELSAVAMTPVTVRIFSLIMIKYSALCFPTHDLPISPSPNFTLLLSTFPLLPCLLLIRVSLSLLLLRSPPPIFDSYP